MIYGHRYPAPAENAAVERALARAVGTWGGYQAWRRLDAEKRLELVEQALCSAANDLDSFPVAL